MSLSIDGCAEVVEFVTNTAVCVNDSGIELHLRAASAILMGDVSAGLSISGARVDLHPHFNVETKQRISRIARKLSVSATMSMRASVVSHMFSSSS